jgi:hypothetical protein
MMHPVVEHLSEELFPPPAEGLLRCGVYERYPPLHVPQEQRIGGIVRYGSGTVALVLQCPLGSVALAYVAQ